MSEICSISTLQSLPPTGTGEALSPGEAAQQVGHVASDVIRGKFTTQEEVRSAMGSALMLDRPATDDEVKNVLCIFANGIKDVLGPGADSIFDGAASRYESLPETSLW